MRESLSSRWDPFYVPSGSHGTLMAELICMVCPVVKLYIAQLDVFKGRDGRRSINIESAAEVSGPGRNSVARTWEIIISLVFLLTGVHPLFFRL